MNNAMKAELVARFENAALALKEQARVVDQVKSQLETGNTDNLEQVVFEMHLAMSEYSRELEDITVSLHASEE